MTACLTVRERWNKITRNYSIDNLKIPKDLEGDMQGQKVKYQCWIAANVTMFSNQIDYNTIQDLI